MTSQSHFTALERLYQAAPMTSLFRAALHVEYGTARLDLVIGERYFHGAGAVHGAVLFKLMDDAAFFAASSLDDEVFMLTSSFTTYFMRPVSQGNLRASGRVLNRGGRQVIAEAVVYDDDSREVARGSGVFVRGRTRLDEMAAYRGD